MRNTELHRMLEIPDEVEKQLINSLFEIVYPLKATL